MRTKAGYTLTRGERKEMSKLLRFLHRVSGGMNQTQAYAEVYGEVVFLDTEAAKALDKAAGR